MTGIVVEVEPIGILCDMRIAAVIGVRDESELIEALISHLYGIGVTKFVVCDVASRDGTREKLQHFESRDFRVVDVARNESQDMWRQRMAATINGLDADWVLPIDADEFPLPMGGDIRPLLAGTDADVLILRRYNVVAGGDGFHMPLPCNPGSYEKIDLFATAPPDFRARLAADPALAWIRFVPKPKVAVRPAVVMSVRDAVHDIIHHPGRNPVRAVSANIILAHVALSSYRRFARKIENIREVFQIYDGSLDPGFGWHWKRWLELAERGELETEFANSRLAASEIARLKAEGVIRTAADILADVQGV